jgi:hypothetical protein
MIKKVELDEIRDRLEECLMELGDHYPEGADEMIQNDLLDAAAALSKLNDDLCENEMQYDFHGYSQIR